MLHAIDFVVSAHLEFSSDAVIHLARSEVSTDRAAFFPVYPHVRIASIPFPRGIIVLR